MIIYHIRNFTSSSALVDHLIDIEIWMSANIGPSGIHTWFWAAGFSQIVIKNPVDALAFKLRFEMYD